ncbi:MAG: alpha/beta fold hydrolase [Synechococcales cyanobacterium RM1_1_8]|nr:alpha/beta fold hydrolase [Synechococcales cyanobacterium RM1_1_8]
MANDQTKFGDGELGRDDRPQPHPYPPYRPPLLLRRGMPMTLHGALVTSRRWPQTLAEAEPPYQEHYFRGAGGVPLFGWVAIPRAAKATLVATYGITGTIADQAMLRVLGRKAYDQGYAVVLFDWRAHGKSAELSPSLTSDGLQEGPDFIHIAAQAIALGAPPRICLSGYSLGGQLALWGLRAAEDPELRQAAGLASTVPVTGVVVCPNLDAWRSLNFLMADPWGRYLERAIARGLRQLAEKLLLAHPGSLDPGAIARADSILAFDRELVIGKLGFETVEDYYRATSPLGFMGELRSPYRVIYAADDPLFHPSLVPELAALAKASPALDLMLTRYGGHVGYLSDRATQRRYGDADGWWACHRTLDWMAMQWQSPTDQEH